MLPLKNYSVSSYHEKDEEWPETLEALSPEDAAVIYCETSEVWELGQRFTLYVRDADTAEVFEVEIIVDWSPEYCPNKAVKVSP